MRKLIVILVLFGCKKEEPQSATASSTSTKDTKIYVKTWNLDKWTFKGKEQEYHYTTYRFLNDSDCVYHQTEKGVSSVVYHDYDLIYQFNNDSTIFIKKDTRDHFITWYNVEVGDSVKRQAKESYKKYWYKELK